MNLEEIKQNNKITQVTDDLDLDFDFKPITSGLGFHHQKTTDAKATQIDRTVVVSPIATTPKPFKKEMNVYQNDLSLFYGQASSNTAPAPELKEKEEKFFRLASKPQRVFAYLTDLAFLVSILGMVMTIMARTIRMDLMKVWSMYPSEITPLVLVLFCGFYLIYFSIFEKASQSTLGKNLFGLRVTDTSDKALPLAALIIRSSVSLLNFVSLGLFSYFDLQNKITDSKVIRID
jgi:uncharacterized RDD family membrane protein YckC